MCDLIWAALAKAGIHRNDPSTWTTARPAHLQHLKADPAFRPIGSERTIQAIDEVLDGQSWQKPRDWGAFFLQFPIGREWDIPNAGWHIDGDYTGELSPPCGVKVHAMLTEVGRRCGGANILSGSHRLMHRWFRENPPPPKTRGAQFRKSLERHPYLRDLYTAGDPEARIARFHDRVEEVDGIPLQVSENTASPGDVILMHSLLLHAGAPAAHLGPQPRFLLNQDIHQPYW
jgi:hypothetical protein